MSDWRWSDIAEFWTNSWFFRVNVTIAVVGLLYWGTRPSAPAVPAFPTVPNYTNPFSPR